MNFLYIIFLVLSFSVQSSFTQIISESSKDLFKYKKVNTYKKVKVAIIDTGIDFNNKYLKNNISTIIGKTSINNFGVDFSNYNMNKEMEITRTPNDTHGHGTHIAGIIKDINPNIEIIALKYYNKNNNGVQSLNSSLKALKYAIDMNVDIINYSGGGPSSSQEEAKLIKEAEEKGILLISAAGNDGKNIDCDYNDLNNKYLRLNCGEYFPANYNYRNIISVGALANKSSLNASSNWGVNSVDVVAPGYEISSTHLGGFKKMTGTSQATAFVTGVASVLKGLGINDSKKIKKIILDQCDKKIFLQKKVKNGCVLNMENILKRREVSSLIR